MSGVGDDQNENDLEVDDAEVEVETETSEVGHESGTSDDEPGEDASFLEVLRYLLQSGGGVRLSSTSDVSSQSKQGTSLSVVCSLHYFQKWTYQRS